MKKIKLNKTKNINKVVKLNNGQKVEIKPYIDIAEAISICKLVIDNYYNPINEETGSIPLQKNILTPVIEYTYIGAVTKYCTNVDMDDCETDIIFESGLYGFLKQEIANYNEILDSIRFAINQENQDLNSDILYNTFADGFKEFANALPKPKEQTEELQKSVDIIKKLAEDKDFKETFESALVNNIIELPNPNGTKKEENKKEVKERVKSVIKDKVDAAAKEVKEEKKSKTTTKKNVSKKK